jgi:hypothetical protein
LPFCQIIIGTGVFMSCSVGIIISEYNKNGVKKGVCASSFHIGTCRISVVLDEYGASIQILKRNGIFISQKHAFLSDEFVVTF